MNARIILASGSAIRRQILDGAGLDYEVIVRPVDEASIKASMLAENSRLRDIADALAEAKAMRASRQEAGLVIGADQIMVMEDQLFDKPKDMDEVRARLISMRGKKHELIGAVVICENGAPVWRHICRTKLWVRDFFFEKVEGGFFAILGLDLLPVLDYLRIRGVVKK